MNVKNLASTKVSVAPSPALTGLTLTVESAALLPAAPFEVTLTPPGVEPTMANSEIVNVEKVVGNVLTVTARGIGGTSAKAVGVGWKCVAGLTQAMIEALTINGKPLPAVLEPVDIEAPAAGQAPQWVKTAAYTAGQAVQNEGWLWIAKANIASGVAWDPTKWTKVGVLLAREHVWINDPAYGAMPGTTFGPQQVKIQAALNKAAEVTNGGTGSVSGLPGFYELGETGEPNFGRVLGGTVGTNYKRFPAPYNNVYAFLHLPVGVTLDGGKAKTGIILRVAKGCNQIGATEEQEAGSRAYAVAINGASKAEKILANLGITTLDPVPSNRTLLKTPPKLIDAVMASGAGSIWKSTIGGNVRSAIIMRCDHFTVYETDMSGWAKLCWPTFMGPAGNNVIYNCGMVGGFCSVYVEPAAAIGGTSFILGHMGFCSGPCFYKLEVEKAGEGFLSALLDHIDIEEPGRGLIIDESLLTECRKMTIRNLIVGSGGIGPIGGRVRGDITQPSAAVVQVGTMREWKVEGRLFTNAGYEPGIGACVRAKLIADCDLGDITDGLKNARSLGVPFMRAETQEGVRAEAQDQTGTRTSIQFRTVQGPASVSRYDLLRPVVATNLTLSAPVAEMFAARLDTAGAFPDGVALQAVSPAAGEVSHVPVAIANKSHRAVTMARLAHLGIGAYKLPLMTVLTTTSQTVKPGGAAVIKASTVGFPPTGTLECGAQTATYTGITPTEFTGVTVASEFVMASGTNVKLVQWPPNPRGAKAKVAGDGVTAGAPLDLGAGVAPPVSLHAANWNNERIRVIWVSSLGDLSASGGVLSNNGGIVHYQRGIGVAFGALQAETNPNPKFLQLLTAGEFGGVGPTGHETLEVTVHPAGSKKKALENGEITLAFKWKGIVYTTAAFHVLKEEFEIEENGKAVFVKIGKTLAEVTQLVQEAKGPGGEELPVGGIEGVSGTLTDQTVVLRCAGTMTGLVRELKLTMLTSLGNGTTAEFAKPAIGVIRIGNTGQGTYSGVSATSPSAVLTAAAKVGATTITVADTKAFVFGSAKGALRFGGQTISYTQVTATQFKGIPASGPGSIGSEIPNGSTIEGFPELTDVVFTGAALPVGTAIALLNKPAELRCLSGAGKSKGVGARGKLLRTIQVDSLLGFSTLGGVVMLEPEAGNQVFALYQTILEAEARTRYMGAELTFPFTSVIPSIIGIGDGAMFKASGTIQLEATKATGGVPSLVEVKYTGKSTATTTLSADIDFSTVTKIKVADTSAFPSTGWLRIGDAEVRYLSKTATEFTLDVGPVDVSIFAPTVTGTATKGTAVTCEVLTGCTFVKGGATGYKIKGGAGLIDTSTIRKYLVGVISEGYFKEGHQETIPAGTVLTDMPVVASSGSSGYPNGPASVAFLGNAQVPYEKFVSIGGEPVEEGEEPEGEGEGSEGGEGEESPELAEVAPESSILAYFVVNHSTLVSATPPTATSVAATGGTLLTAAVANLATATSLPVYSVDNWPSVGVLRLGTLECRYGKIADETTTVASTVAKMEGTFSLKVASVAGFPGAGGLRVGRVFLTYTAANAGTNTFEGCKVDTSIEGSVAGIAATEGQTVKVKPEFLELTERSGSGALAQYQPVSLAFGKQVPAQSVVGAALGGTRESTGDQGLVAKLSPGDLTRWPFAVTAGPDEGGSVPIELGAV